MANRCDSSAASAVWWAFVSEFAEAAACRCEAHPDSSTLSGSNRKASFFICSYITEKCPPREGSVAGVLFYRGAGAASRSVLLFPIRPALPGLSLTTWQRELRGCVIAQYTKKCEIMQGCENIDTFACGIR